MAARKDAFEENRQAPPPDAKSTPGDAEELSASVPDPEVEVRPGRRRFTGRYKLEILHHILRVQGHPPDLFPRCAEGLAGQT